MLLVIALGMVMYVPNLPLKFTLQESTFAMAALVSLIGVVYMLIKCFSKSTNNQVNSLEILLLLIFLYLIVQLVPFPKSLVAIISPQAALIWDSGAYGFANQASLSVDITGTFIFMNIWLAYAGIFCLIVRLVSSTSRFVMIAAMLFALGLYQITFDEITKLLGQPYVAPVEIDGHVHRLTGTFVNSNNISALINISISAGFALLVLILDKLKSHKSFILMIVLLLVIAGELLLFYGSVKAGSAGGFLSLLVSIIIISIVIGALRSTYKFILPLCLFGLVVLILLIVIGGQEVNLTKLTQKLSLSGRPELWAQVITMWKDFPLFGIGAGAFEWMFVAYKTDDLLPLRVYTAHSGYLHMFVELGLIGFGLLTLFMLIYFKQIGLILANQQLKPYLAGSLLVGVLAFLIQECVEANLLMPGVAMPFIALMALTLITPKLNIEKENEQ